MTGHRHVWVTGHVRTGVVAPSDRRAKLFGDSGDNLDSMRKPAIVATVALVLLLVMIAAMLGVKVQHQLSTTRNQVARERLVPLLFGPLSPVANIGFQPLAAPEAFQAGIVYDGRFYLAGAGGLAEYVTLHDPPRLFRIGIELPPAPIVRMAIGMLRGDARPQLMLATQGAGVLLYNGNSFRQMLPGAAAARDVTALLPLESGDLLIGTRQMGLLVFNGKTLSPFQENLRALHVTALAGNEGDFWMGTRNHGVFHWHAGEFDHFDGNAGTDKSNAPADLPDPQVEAIVLASGKAYVGTPVGVEEFEATTGNGRPLRTLAPGLFAHALVVDENTDGNTLTIATIDQGVREVTLTKRSIHSEDRISPETESFFTANSGTVFAVGRDGVFRRGPHGDWSRILDTLHASLADRNVAALAFAPDGRLWVGYFDHGLDILATNAHPGEESLPVVQHVEDDHVFCINRIVADPGRKTMDIATANGLALFDTTGRQRQILLKRDGLIADQVTDVLITRDQTTIATPAGITFIDTAGTQSIYAFHGLVNNHVYALAASPSDQGSRLLLAGTLGGISLLNANTVQRNLTTANSGLKHNWITAIAPVDDGWFVGTYGAGVMHLAADGLVTATANAGGPMEINPNAMLVTTQHIFAGSLGQGLLVCSRGSDQINRWSRIYAGLPSLNVTAIAQYGGYIYVGTDNGIVRIAEQRFEQAGMPL